MFNLYSRDQFREKKSKINEGFLDDAKEKLGKLWDKISSSFKNFFSHPDVTTTEKDGAVVGTLQVDGKEFVTIFDFGGESSSDAPKEAVLESKINEEQVTMTNPNTEIADVTYDDLYEELEFFSENKDKSMFLWGAPGIGKTQTIIRFAKDKGLELIIVNTSVKDPTDFIGLPSITRDEKTGEGTTKFNLPDFWPRVKSGSENAEKPGILFFDELNTAPQPVLVSCQQLILDRKLDNYKVPNNWMVAAAGNRRIDNPQAVKVMSAPLSNRFYHINLIVDVDSWEKWFAGVAKDSEGTLVVMPLILSFLKNKPEWLHHLDTDKMAEGSPWPSPRTWTMASEKLKWKLKKDPKANKNDIIKAISGFVGTAAASEFAEYYMSNADVDSIKNIFTDWEKGPKLSELGGLDNLDLFNATLDIASNYLKDHYNNTLTIVELENLANYIISLNNDELASALGKKLLSQGARALYKSWNKMKKDNKPDELNSEQFKRLDAVLNDKTGSLVLKYPNLND